MWWDHPGFQVHDPDAEPEVLRALVRKTATQIWPGQTEGGPAASPDGASCHVVVGW